MVLDLSSNTVGDLATTCENLRLPVSMGVWEITPEVDWQDDHLIELREDVTRWRDEIAASTLEPIHKRNIIRALDDVIEAIENYSSKGANNLTDAMFRAKAMIEMLTPLLTKVATSKLAESVFKMLPEGD